MITEASDFLSLLVNFSPMFTSPSFNNFVSLACGWVLCIRRRTISRVIQFASVGEEQRHHSIFYYFFSRTGWIPDELGRRLFQMVLRLLPESLPICLTVDDTLSRKSGPQIFGGGMHHDPLLSNYGRGKTLVKFFSFGHNWVILCVVVPLPWNTARFMAIPVAFRLYRGKKHCPSLEYRKRTESAREMVEMVLRWIPEDRKVVLIGDSEYACRTLVRDLNQRITFVGSMNMDAALYDLPGKSGQGRPRKKGKRLLSPRQLAAADHIQWEPHEIVLYGRKVKVLIKTQRCLWYTVSGSKLTRMIVTRDPRGRLDDRAYFITDAETGVSDLAHLFSLRWTQEEMHRNVKQHLGLEDPQNGWWRRPKGERRNKNIPGPQPHKERGARAVYRTVPFVLTIYGLVVLWYLANGCVEEDVKRARLRAPWYRHKSEPSFGDMLGALRRHLWAERGFSDPSSHQGSSKLIADLEDLLCAS
jgi:hypothetical protein